jgi:hypothetical protein
LPIPNRILPYQKDVIVQAIRSGCPLPCFTVLFIPFYLIVIYYRFAAAVRPLVDLFSRKGNRLLQSCQCRRSAASEPQKSSFPSVERIFSHQPCQIVSATFWRQKNKSQRSQTDRTKGNSNNKNKNSIMKTEIRQNGKVILSSTDDISIPMIFKNLCGKNFSGNDYQNYLRTVCQDIGVTTGTIEYYVDNVLIEKGTIPEF